MIPNYLLHTALVLLAWALLGAGIALALWVLWSIWDVCKAYPTLLERTDAP